MTVLLCVCLAGCTRVTTVSEYLQWYKEHKELYTASTSNELYTFTAAYQPALYLASRRNHENTQKVLHEKEEMEGVYQFHLKIEVNDEKVPPIRYRLSDDAMYYRRIEYFSFTMQNDVKLASENDTINCRIFHFEKDQNQVPYNSFVLGFDSKDIEHIKGDDLYLVIKGGVYDNQDLILPFSKKKLIETASKLEDLC